MNDINLDDYYVSVEYLDNLPNNDIDSWISSGNSEKISKKLKKLYKHGGSFESNKYQVTSTDPILLPFMYHNGTKYIIEYAETRLIHFLPSLPETAKELSKVKPEQVDLDLLPEKETKKRGLSSEFKRDLKTEGIDLKTKKRKVDEQNGDLEKKVDVQVEMNSTKKKAKKKKNKSTVETEQIPKEISIKSEPVVKKKKKHSNGEEALDISLVKNETSVKEFETLQNTEIEVKNKKSKDKSKVKSVDPNVEIKTEQIVNSNSPVKHTDDVNAKIDIQENGQSLDFSPKLEDSKAGNEKPHKSKKKRHSEPGSKEDLKEEKTKKSKKNKHKE